VIRFKKILRIVVLTIFIILAAAGAGLVGMIPNYRERFMNNEIKIEMVDKKRGEDEGEEEEEEENKN
jgi:hypothetical protein